MSFDGLVPSRPIEPVTYGSVSGSAARPFSAFATPQPRQLRALHDLALGADRALADQHRDLLAGVQDLRRTSQLGVTGQRARLRVADARVRRAMGAARLRVRHLLDVGRHDDAGRRARRQRDADGAVDQVPRLRRRVADVDELVRDVLEQRDEVDLLLVVGAERGARLLADDRDDRLLVELRVVEAVEEMDRSGPRRGHADPEVVGELGVGGRREGGDLLVPDLDELEPVADVVEGAEQSVDAVAGVAVDALDPPVDQAVEHVGGDVL
jgi:hypothetical protein